MSIESQNFTDSPSPLHRPIDRREMLRRVALMFGGALSAPAVLGVLNGCSAEVQTTSTSTATPLQFLTAGQFETVTAVVDLIIPATDTPGAIAVGVPRFIDLMLKEVYASEHQQRFLTGLADLDSKASARSGGAFLALGVDAREQIVQETLTSALKSNNGAPPAWEQRPFILMIRELTLLGFFTSEIGATQILQYDPVPGDFEACLPLAKAGNGRTWATETSLPF